MMSHLSHKRILVVEDSLEIRESLEELFVLENFEVTLAEQGEAAIQYLHSTPTLPDLILLDLLMPIMDGYEFLKIKKEDQRIADIPVIIMTANQMQDAQSLGTAGFMRKPISVALLMKAVSEVLNHSSRE